MTGCTTPALGERREAMGYALREWAVDQHMILIGSGLAYRRRGDVHGCV